MRAYVRGNSEGRTGEEGWKGSRKNEAKKVRIRHIREGEEEG